MADLTIPRLLRASADRYGDLQAVADNGTSLTFAELADAALLAARAARARGIGPGDRVAIWAPNTHRWIVSALGALCAGATVVPVNTRYRGAEARELLARTQSRGLFVEQGFLGYDHLGALLDSDRDADAAGPGIGDLRLVVDLSAGGGPGGPARLGWDEFLGSASGVSPAAAIAAAHAVRPDDLSEIIFTSGTTGRAKGVTLAHGPGIRLYERYGEIWGLRAGDRYLISLPLFHTGGNKAGLIACLIHGVTMVPLTVFDAAAAMATIERERITVMNGPPTIYSMILDHPGRPGFDLSSLRLAATGAAVVPDVLVERARTERLANFKVPRSIAFVETLPRNASGKVLRRDLRARAEAGQSEVTGPPRGRRAGPRGR